MPRLPGVTDAIPLKILLPAIGGQFVFGFVELIHPIAGALLCNLVFPGALLAPLLHPLLEFLPSHARYQPRRSMSLRSLMAYGAARWSGRKIRFRSRKIQSTSIHSSP